jgi:ABC-2 type transport system permease protein
MLGVASVSLFLSTLTDSALGAALGGLAVLAGSTVLVALEAAGSVNDWLPTRYWLAWVDLFRDPILWHDVGRGVLVQAIWIAVMLGMAWAAFTTRDVTS